MRWEGSSRSITPRDAPRSLQIAAHESTWGYTTTDYDALGRVKTVVEQDGSATGTSYSDNCTTVTDEVGNARTSCVDGLGRMTSVVEDPGSPPHLNYQTFYQYDALGNLLCAAQQGTVAGTFTNCASAPAAWRPRSFVYDSLSRLTQAVNPESGTILYSYVNSTGSLCSGDASEVCINTLPAPNQTTGTVSITNISESLTWDSSAAANSTTYAFKTVSKIAFLNFTSGTTFKAGVTALLGLNTKLSMNTVQATYLDGTIEASPATTVSSTALGLNTMTLGAGTLALTKPVDVYYVVN